MKINRRQIRQLIESYGKLPDDLNFQVAMHIKDMMPAEEAAGMRDDDLYGLITTVFDREFDTTGEGWDPRDDDIEEIRDHLTVLPNPDDPDFDPEEHGDHWRWEEHSDGGDWIRKESFLREETYETVLNAGEKTDDEEEIIGESRMRITKKQLKKIIREALEQEPEFPDIKHPTIAQFADKTSGPQEPHGGSSWFVSSQAYRYKAGGTSDQGITVYLLPDGEYMARVFGSHSNTLSNDRQAGHHPDAESAIEAALDSSPSGREPFARDLLLPVGEKVKPGGYHRQD